jgi:hypothetical protein
VSGEGVEPGFEAFGLAEGVDFLDDQDADVLEDFIDIVGVLQEVVSQAVEPGPVFLHKCLHSSTFPVTSLTDQGRFGLIFFRFFRFFSGQYHSVFRFFPDRRSRFIKVRISGQFSVFFSSKTRYFRSSTIRVLAAFVSFSVSISIYFYVFESI